MTLHELRAKLEKAWGPDTAFPGSTGTGSTGQCAATALVVQKLLGGEVRSTTVEGRSHWFNRIDGWDVDLTGDQFGFTPVLTAEQVYATSKPRPALDANDETIARARVLLARVG